MSEYLSSLGVSKYTWCIGTKPHLCDALPRTQVTEPVLVVTAQTAMFTDGQEYHVLLEVKSPMLLSDSV